MSFDVAIVGAGTAGAGAAWQCAKRGMKVVCVDDRPLEQAGARWLNGVARWQLEEAGVPHPKGDELYAEGGPFHLLAGWGPQRVSFDACGVIELDMRKLVARLQDLACRAGAQLRGQVRVRGLADDLLDTSEGPLRADVIVDASGLAGARLAPTPALPAEHICAAAQAVHAVADPAAARAYFARHEVPEGETLCFSGIAGGYSILNMRLEGDEVALLTGSIPAEGHPSGQALLERFVAEQPWVGAAAFGGVRAIPIRRPFDRLAYGRVAIVGDAASQVFSAHGSGIGVGLIAGRILAEALADGEGLEGYERRFLREQGGKLAAYDILRRFSQTLKASEVETFMRLGLIDAEGAAAVTAQRWPMLERGTLSTKLEGLARAPKHGLAFAALGARMASVAAAYRVYPGAGPGTRSLAAWSRAVAALVRDQRPDIP